MVHEPGLMIESEHALFSVDICGEIFGLLV